MLLPAAVVLSCEKEINSDIPDIDPFISVTSTFAPDSTWKVWVGKSCHILDDQGPGLINDAVVEIYEEGTLLETIAPSGFLGGTYYGTTAPAMGKNYTIKVSAPGYAMVTGSSKTPAAVPLLSISQKDSVFTLGDGYYQDEVTFSFADPAGEKNYYGITMAYMDTVEYLGDTMIYWSSIWFTNPDPTMNAFQGETMFFSDGLVDGKVRTVSLRYDDYFSFINKDIYLILSTCTEDYYQFEATYHAYQINYGNPFSEPVQLHNNLSGGVGIFAGYSNYTVVIP